MNNVHLKLLAVIVVAPSFLALAPTADADDSIRDALEERITWLSSAVEPTIDGAPIAASLGIAELFSRRGYEPVWTDPKMVDELYDHVLRSVEHGLNPEDFHAAQIGRRVRAAARMTDPANLADSEILFTDAFARLVVTLHFGKLDPTALDPAWNFSRRFRTQDPVEMFNQVLSNKSIGTSIESADPTFSAYDRLRNALVTYRKIKGAGGWPTIPGGKVLEVGSRGPRVALLRQRLQASGDYVGSAAADSEVFEPELAEAVERFQTRHGISVDGKVGKRSLEELNVPVDARIDQIRATMERMRWVFRDIPVDFVVVDIAGFNLHLFRNGEITWTTKVQVGKPYHATPVFRDEIQYLEFNPTWTIPPGILRNETLPRVRKDPDYLSRNNMSVITTSGKLVDPSTIDWPATATKGFPYMIRQEPGPHNALGRVKFIFPNKYMVYLHDTPSKGLFARAERAFSHGCIRTQNPFDLAELLLADQGWDRARIGQVLDSLKTTRVNLSKRLPVMLLYWTAEANEDGSVQFRKDVYSRDAKIIKGLDAPFQIAPPQGTLANPG